MLRWNSQNPGRIIERATGSGVALTIEGSILTGGEALPPSLIRVEGGRIVSVQPIEGGDRGGDQGGTRAHHRQESEGSALAEDRHAPRERAPAAPPRREPEGSALGGVLGQTRRDRPWAGAATEGSALGGVLGQSPNFDPKKFSSPSRGRGPGGGPAASEGVEPSVHLAAPPGGWIVPGLIDLHLHGAGGVDLTAAEDPASAIQQVARRLVTHGVTAFCPTLVSAAPHDYERILPACRPHTIKGGATVLGAYLEGPFLNPAHRGVHDPEWVRLPNRAEAARWLLPDLGPPAIVTLAPELDGALDLARSLADAGVLVSLGHSGASLDEARLGLEAGARHGTHLFNAMPPLHHRQPGLVGALLDDERATLEVIADGTHVSPVMIGLTVRAAGVHRVVLVSDALAAADMLPGAPVSLGSQAIVSEGHVARRADGTLAGSVTLLDAALRNVRRWLPWLPPAKIVQMATATPARALGPHRAEHTGQVAPGFDADLVILDAEWEVLHTVVSGELVYSRGA